MEMKLAMSDYSCGSDTPTSTQDLTSDYAASVLLDNGTSPCSTSTGTGHGLLSDLTHAKLKELRENCTAAAINGDGDFAKAKLLQACLQIEATIPEKTKASPQWSVGSALHASELCSPCAWVWKSRGCRDGRACDFCHMCPADAMKKHRKEKAARVKAALRTKHDLEGELSTTDSAPNSPMQKQITGTNCSPFLPGPGGIQSVPLVGTSAEQTFQSKRMHDAPFYGSGPKQWTPYEHHNTTFYQPEALTPYFRPPPGLPPPERVLVLAL
mmetsp:Transcript_14859/g.33844  ORF Transcript_14859/g.33844 Transcript_14859/m.33844 type:complete len:269 (+) Transcript_14859:109-915(+)